MRRPPNDGDVRWGKPWSIEPPSRSRSDIKLLLGRGESTTRWSSRRREPSERCYRIWWIEAHCALVFLLDKKNFRRGEYDQHKQYAIFHVMLFIYLQLLWPNFDNECFCWGDIVFYTHRPCWSCSICAPDRKHAGAMRPSLIFIACITSTAAVIVTWVCLPRKGECCEEVFLTSTSSRCGCVTGCYCFCDR
ncbi:unnamed protein product [Musa acuminata subsp. burmannicoides]